MTLLTALKGANLAVRFLLELCPLGALGYWGFTSGGNLVAKIVLGIGTPFLAAITWGLFVAPKATIPLSMPLRLVPEALVFVSAAAALYATGHPVLAVVFSIAAAMNRALISTWAQ